jgi:predicted ATPase/DNA-binding XRE family transcriptional regulator
MATTSTSTFGALLRRHRLAVGLTQEALAERSGLSARGVQDLERGVRRAPRAETVRLLADALGLSGDARSGLIAAAHPELVSPPTMRAAPLHMASPPVPPTPLVGREREVAAACALLRQLEVRLLTLTGPGGVGKTRLALAIASEIAADFADGVAWAELASLQDAELVAGAVARALGVHEPGDPTQAEALAAVVGDRSLLLVLDNLEHLLEATPLISQLLAAAPHLTVLTTSRVRLRLRGERELPVPPLAVPAATDDGHSPLAGLAGVAAVRLFVERAVEVRPGFALTAENAPAVAAICRRLDGLPLALELAASRVKLLPPAMLLARLEQRLPLLCAGARDLPLRQQTMRDTIAWSYDLLTPAEQNLCRRFAIFAGGFSLEAAEALCPTDLDIPVIDGIASLLDHNLVQRVEGPDDETRVGMLETIREYGLERLDEHGEREEVSDAHTAYYLALAEAAEVGLQGAGQVRWLERLDTEHDNLRAALRWLPMRGQTDAALRLAGAIWLCRWIRGYYAESRAQLEALLALPDATQRTEARARALNSLGVIALSQGDTERAVAAHEEALAIARELGTEQETAFSLVCLGAAVMTRSEYSRAEAVTTESLTLCRKLGNRWGVQMAIANLAFVAYRASDFERAEALFNESLEIGRALGERWSTALKLDNLGWLALRRGDGHAPALFEEALAMMDELGDRRDRPDALTGLGRAVQRQGDLARTIALYEECLAIAGETGDLRGMALTLLFLGDALWQQGNGDEALAHIRQALAGYDAMGDLLYVAASIEAMAVLADARGEAERAARLLGATSALLERIGAVIPSTDRFTYNEGDMQARGSLGDASYATAWETGRALPPEQIVAETLAWADTLI